MTEEPTAEKDAPGPVVRLLLLTERFLRWVQKWADVEQRRRDLKCWHRGHRGNPCRRCGRDIPPGGGR